ncbi:MAG: SBBP repeat-containing protein, partial [Deltaproteobacteria bacterium]|nr:SBBP repeat-containing protein [Deltaproteobacteria bacterium]
MEPAIARTDPTSGMAHRDADYGNIPLFFIPNKGQLDERVAYAIRGRDKSVYFTPEGLTFVLSEPVKALPANKKRFLREIEPGEVEQVVHQKRWVVKLGFVGSRRDVRPESLEQADTLISYFRGRPGEWKAGLRTSSKIIYRDLWPGIDLVYYGTVNRMKYEFIVHPGADPERIRLSWRGADRVEVTREGRLELTTPAGILQDDIPVAWQETDGQRTGVPVAYALERMPGVHLADLSLSADDSAAFYGTCPQYGDHVYGFKVGAYDRSRTLVLDPAMLVYCGYIGGSNGDIGIGIAVDGAGNAYVTGYTASTEATFPVAVGPDLTFNGLIDAFVAKVNASGTALAYCGYIGGSGLDIGYGIAVDGAGNAYV